MANSYLWENTYQNNFNGTHTIHAHNLNKGIRVSALIDSEDIDRVRQYLWVMILNGWEKTRWTLATRISNPAKILRLHRFIIECPEGKEVHHKNENWSDCRKSNLQALTPSEHRSVHKQINRTGNGDHQLAFNFGGAA